MEIDRKKEDNISTYKELLNNLFKESFENKLKTLEKRGENQMLIISSTKTLIKNITSVTIKIHNQILSKLKKDKRNSTNKSNKYLSLKKNHSPKLFILKRALGFKTPIRPDKLLNKQNIAITYRNSKKIDSKIKRHLTNIRDTKREKSKCTINNNNKYKTIDNENMYKTYITWFNNKNKKEILNRTSIGSLKSKEKEKINKGNNINCNIDNHTNHQSRNNAGLLSKLLKNINKTENLKDSKSNRLIINKTFEKRKSKIKNDSSSLIIFQKNKKKEDKNIKNMKGTNIEKTNTKIKKSNNNYNKINSMESNLQKDDHVFQNDPLLVSPITEIDFLQGEQMNQNSNKTKNITEFFKNIEKKNIRLIFEFLNINDLIKLKSVAKYFNKNILNFCLNNLCETKNKLENMKKIMVYNKEPKNFKNFKFSKDTEQSIQLLNEDINNKFFQEQNPPKNKDILFVFEIFFQLINNPIIKNKNNKNEFWEKCRFYFINESKGKIGDLLRKIIINNEIDLSEDNLYKIYNLSKNKLKSIIPLNFKNICNTIIYFAFYIKDILTFLGISSEEEDIKQNGFWTYSNIINSLDKKINEIHK